ncbi:MAG: hypothetical protein KA247_08640, partial [Bacteroidetes bacterium]|nr:hypothetical protein [Bacteroidota bacterium]
GNTASSRRVRLALFLPLYLRVLYPAEHLQNEDQTVTLRFTGGSSASGSSHNNDHLLISY